jgi:NADH dehydrogenase [ubiquinone] 1 alpha subcomplex assembly factor 7
MGADPPSGVIKPFADTIRRLIEADGPMSVATYMAHCLCDPQHGYYATRDPFGAAGDFVTAPEISQMFGEIVGAWVIHAWDLAGAPSPVSLVELGPGRGTLMADILRVSGRRPDFAAAASVHLVETSPVLRAKQAAILARGGHRADWHDSFAEVPAGAALLVANEFFDALPIRQFVRVEGRWRERVVGLDERRRLAFGIGPGLLDQGPEAAEGAILEVSPAGEALAAEIAGRIAAEGAAALVVDYGHSHAGLGATLQAVRGHAFADPLADPGEADLTAHVDFAALAASAARAGAAVHGPMTQGEFLVSLGILERAGRLGAAADEVTREAIGAAVERLAGSEQMGKLFKVLAITRPGVTPPPFGPKI